LYEEQEALNLQDAQELIKSKDENRFWNGSVVTDDETGVSNLISPPKRNRQNMGLRFQSSPKHNSYHFRSRERK
jgi:hypothetical protein